MDLNVAYARAICFMSLTRLLFEEFRSFDWFSSLGLTFQGSILNLTFKYASLFTIMESKAWNRYEPVSSGVENVRWIKLDKRIRCTKCGTTVIPPKLKMNPRFQPIRCVPHTRWYSNGHVSHVLQADIPDICRSSRVLLIQSIYSGVLVNHLNLNEIGCQIERNNKCKLNLVVAQGPES